MRHVVVHRPGGHERLQIETAPDPELGEGEVVVESAAIGVNYCARGRVRSRLPA